MTWQPGQPLMTASDHADWQAWRKTSKLEQQRARRRMYFRIDYYPSKEALALILESASGRDNSSVIDELVLGNGGELPE